MKCFKGFVVTAAFQAVLLAGAVGTGYVAVSALPVVVPLVLALAWLMN